MQAWLRDKVEARRQERRSKRISKWNRALSKAVRTSPYWEQMEQASLSLMDNFPVAGMSAEYASGQQMDWVTMDPVSGMHVRGISDTTGSHSFATAVIQVLLGIPALVQIIVMSPISSKRPILRALTLLFDYFLNPACPSPEAEPVNAGCALQSVTAEFEAWGGDPDPAEFLQWLLMRLHDETRLARKISLLKDWDESIIRRVVSGILWVGNGFDGFDVLGVEVPQKDATVERLLKEMLHSSEEGEAFGLQHAPPVLMVSLSRTAEDDNLGVNVFLSKSVYIPITRGEVFETIHYDLRVAVVQDDAKVSTFVKYDMTWYNFQNERVSLASWNDVVQHTQDATILVFTRRASDLGRVDLRLPCSPCEFWTSPPPPDQVDKDFVGI
jgi:hypothetical protein